MKSKHIKKIKSKTFHRLLKKDRLKAASSDYEIDPEAVKELARKHEYERAKVIDFSTYICSKMFAWVCSISLEILSLNCPFVDPGAHDTEAQNQLNVGKAHQRAWFKCPG